MQHLSEIYAHDKLTNRIRRFYERKEFRQLGFNEIRIGRNKVRSRTSGIKLIVSFVLCLSRNLRTLFLNEASASTEMQPVITIRVEL